MKDFRVARLYPQFILLKVNPYVLTQCEDGGTMSTVSSIVTAVTLSRSPRVSMPSTRATSILQQRQWTMAAPSLCRRRQRTGYRCRRLENLREAMNLTRRTSEAIPTSPRMETLPQRQYRPLCRSDAVASIQSSDDDRYRWRRNAHSPPGSRGETPVGLLLGRQVLWIIDKQRERWWERVCAYINLSYSRRGIIKLFSRDL